jgi:hypothetical protein
LAFFVQNDASFCKEWDHNIVFLKKEKNTIFSAENCDLHHPPSRGKIYLPAHSLARQKERRLRLASRIEKYIQQIFLLTNLKNSSFAVSNSAKSVHQWS